MAEKEHKFFYNSLENKNTLLRLKFKVGFSLYFYDPRITPQTEINSKCFTIETNFLAFMTFTHLFHFLLSLQF